MYQNLAVLAALLVLYASLAGALESKPVNGPLLFLLAGLVAGPSGLGLLNLSLDRNDLRLLAELTLSIVLFNDAAKANLAQLRQSRSLPLRLLTLGLPLTLIAGWLAAWLMFPRMPWLEMALLSTILAPTDAALGKAVVSNPDVPADVRESLNVESGLNDGICVPVTAMAHQCHQQAIGACARLVDAVIRDALKLRFLARTRLAITWLLSSPPQGARVGSRPGISNKGETP